MAFISGLASTSAPVPSSRTRPASITPPWVASARPALTFCSTSRMGRPPACIRWTCSYIAAAILGARPMEGSSRTTSAGSSMRARANSTCFCPRGVKHEGPGELDHPLLAAGELAPPLAGPLADDRELLGNRVHAPSYFRRVPDEVGTQLDVLPHGQIREKVLGLHHLHDTGLEDLLG